MRKVNKMPHLLYAFFSWTLLLIFVKTRFPRLWMGGFIGIAIGTVVDFIGIKLDLFYYPEGFFYIAEIPIFNLFGTYAMSILYLYWLPSRWRNRFLYTAYISVIFLAIEALIYSFGGIAYPNWKLWYSYFLLVAGLTGLGLFYGIITSPVKERGQQLH